MAGRGGRIALTKKTVPDRIEKVNAAIKILHVHVNFLTAGGAYLRSIRVGSG
jgi:hypothetical protein